MTNVVMIIGETVVGRKQKTWHEGQSADTGATTLKIARRPVHGKPQPATVDLGAESCAAPGGSVVASPCLHSNDIYTMERGSSMSRPLQLAILAVVTAVTFSGCGLLGGDGFEEYALAVYQVTDADSKLDIILEEESSGVALAVFGSKDWSGSVEEIQGVAVADAGTNSFGIAYVHANGNPTSYETKEGWSFTFTK